MPRTTRAIDSLRAQEHKTREALAAQQRALASVQAKMRAEQRRLDQARWQQLGQLADAAGLGELPLAVLPAAFRMLAALAAHPTLMEHWQQATPTTTGEALVEAVLSILAGTAEGA
jgi:hypothetical protein